MVSKKTWKEFKDSGLLWWVNSILHTFGWAIVFNMEDGEIKEAYPARVNFRGFDEKINDDGYMKITKYMQENSGELLDEIQ